jgi:lysozyme
VKRYELDQTGLELIISFEGEVDHAYHLPGERYLTIAVGHYGADVRPGETVTHTQAIAMLHADAERICMEPMRRLIHVPLNANRVRALASATFNCGAGFLSGTVGHRLNARDYHGAADAFLLWDNPPVLRARREAERHLFLTPVKGRSAPPAHLPWLHGVERERVLEYDRLLAEHKDIARRRELRDQMHQLVVNIAYAAHHHGGWEIEHRRQRYHSLVGRSS